MGAGHAKRKNNRKRSGTFYGLIVLSLSRLLAGVAYLPLIITWKPFCPCQHLSLLSVLSES